MAYDDTLFQLGMGLTRSDTDQREENLGTGFAHTSTYTALTCSYPPLGAGNHIAFAFGRRLVREFLAEEHRTGPLAPAAAVAVSR